jgi:molybdopterin/thiamine biosynthesis adenylyltransferase
MFLHVPGHTACFECERRSAAATSAVPPAYADNPCSAPASGLIGSMAALEAVKLLSGAMEPATLGRRLIFDLRTMNIRFQEGIRYPDCPMCSRA